jgi:tripartite-type tricarboxylate transporter receptor subunit TctC
MKRRTLGLAALGFAGPTLTRGQNAWPVRTVRLVVPQAAGSPIEIPTRIVAEHLTRRLGATFIVENRAGAGGGIGTQFVAQQAPDGATFLATSSGIAIIPTLQPSLGFDPLRDLDPVSLLCDVPSGLLVGAQSSFTSLAELLIHAKARPGALTYASGGVGSANHLAGALFCALAGVEMMHVPYRGVSQAVTAVYGGDIALIFGSTLELLQHVGQGRARLLGVTTPARVPALPGVPAIAETVPGYAAPNWFCLMAPKGLPPALLSRLTAELALLRDAPELRTRLAEGAATPRLDGPAPLGARLAEEVEKWRDLVARAGIRPE